MEEQLIQPSKIYKYVSLEVAKIILKDKTLKFSKPSTFNDPYDCDVNLVDFDFSGSLQAQGPGNGSGQLHCGALLPSPPASSLFDFDVISPHRMPLRVIIIHRR